MKIEDRLLGNTEYKIMTRGLTRRQKVRQAAICINPNGSRQSPTMRRHFTHLHTTTITPQRAQKRMVKRKK